MKLVQLLLFMTCAHVTSAGLLDFFTGGGAPTPSYRFSFGKKFIGTWSVTRSDQTMVDGGEEEESVATYNILSENYTTALVGAYVDMDGEVGHLVRVEFEDDTLNNGKFFTAGPPGEDAESEWLEEGDDDSLLFDFDFTDMGANGMYHSSGIWRSQSTKSGWDNFIFYGENTFVLSVVPHDAEGSAFLIRGQRLGDNKPRVEQPWYTRLMLPLSMFFLMRRFLPGAGGDAAPAAAAAAPAAQ